MKHHAPQPEFRIADESFALVAQTTLDGDRIQAQQAQSARDRARAAQRQTDFLIPTPNSEP